MRAEANPDEPNCSYWAWLLAWGRVDTDGHAWSITQRIAYLTRYAPGAWWLFEVDTLWLRDFHRAIGELVERENKPR